MGGASEIAYNIIPVIEAAGGKVLVRANVTGINAPPISYLSHRIINSFPRILKRNIMRLNQVLSSLFLPNCDNWFRLSCTLIKKNS